MSKAFKIYSGDYSQDGYDSGVDDGKNSKSKNRFKFFKAVNPINYVWAFNNSYDSFMSSYDRGYLDGQRVKHQVYNTTNNKGATMNQNYESHLQMINQLKETLGTLQNTMDNIKGNYKRQINAMKNQGFLDNYIIPLQDRYSKFSNIIDTLQKMIDEHKNQISLHEDRLEQLIADARS